VLSIHLFVIKYFGKDIYIGYILLLPCFPSTMHYGRIYVDKDVNSCQESFMLKLFVKWCMKRRLYPKSLSISFQPDIFPLKEEDEKYNDFLEIFQHVEMLRGCECMRLAKELSFGSSRAK